MEYRNILWNPELKRLMFIDFERSTLDTRSRTWTKASRKRPSKPVTAAGIFHARSSIEFEACSMLAHAPLLTTQTQPLLSGTKLKDKGNLAPLAQDWLDSEEDGQSLKRLLL